MRRATNRMALLGGALLALLAAAGCSTAAAPAERSASAPASSPSSAPVAAPGSAPVAAAAPTLLVDMHLDTVTEMSERNITWDDRRLEASLPALLQAGVNVVVQAAWIPRGDPDPRGTGIGKIRRIRNMVRQSKGRAALVTGPAQLERVVAEGRIAVVIALEGGTALTAGEKTLREFRSLGLSMLGLTWSESSAYADSSAEPRAGDAGGLTAEGRAMVRLANELGLILDVSHMSDRATAETVALSRAPVVASHSNASALCDVPRNLSDGLLQAITKRGGLVGAMFHGPFVVAERKAVRADVVAQIVGLVERLGADHVGLGSDWDGKIKSPLALAGPGHLAALRTELAAAGLSEAQLRRIWGGNFLDLWRAVEAERAEASGPAAERGVTPDRPTPTTPPATP
jgi:membrane dipeptidase